MVQANKTSQKGQSATKIKLGDKGNYTKRTDVLKNFWMDKQQTRPTSLSLDKWRTHHNRKNAIILLQQILQSNIDGTKRIRAMKEATGKARKMIIQGDNAKPCLRLIISRCTDLIQELLWLIQFANLSESNSRETRELNTILHPKPLSKPKIWKGKRSTKISRMHVIFYSSTH